MMTSGEVHDLVHGKVDSEAGPRLENLDAMVSLKFKIDIKVRMKVSHTHANLHDLPLRPTRRGMHTSRDSPPSDPPKNMEKKKQT